MEKIEHALKQYFGHEMFREGQREIIEYTLAGYDTFVLMPTGGGKSLTYQLPALLMPGLSIVISPLIALMHDQVDRLKANGIAATFVNSTISPDERVGRERAALNSRLKLLYVAPERLVTGNFLAFLGRQQPSEFARIFWHNCGCTIHIFTSPVSTGLTSTMKFGKSTRVHLVS